MARFELVMPKLGESIIEATITKWMKVVGDQIEEDDPILEIATDKVDSEIPSPVDGKLVEVFFEEGETVEVGKVIAVIAFEDEDGESEQEVEQGGKRSNKVEEGEKSTVDSRQSADEKEAATDVEEIKPTRFYSPLVKSIAKEENISIDELETIKGSGKDGRLTKKDILEYIGKRPPFVPGKTAVAAATSAKISIEAPKVSTSEGDEIIEMDRMRRLIADHMVMSKHVSPHVTMFHEVDMTKIVNWRNKIKEDFLKREGEKITFTPLFIEAAAKALKDFPMVNASVDGYNIILRKDVNIGMATALPNGNLIVPVIKKADLKNLRGLTKDVNDLANRARNKKLDPDDIQGGTFTVTNFGAFGSLTGAPIINQPQAAILGIGTIRKTPVVIEMAEGDMIGIRPIMILSLAFDHRIVDGALGGMFLQRVAKYLEEFDTERTI